jgi:multiple sugar transport system permease protein
MGMTSPSGRSMKAVSNAVLIVIAICFAVPLAWLLLASFDPSATLSAKVPSQFTLDNFTAVLTPEISFVPLANSLIVSGGCALVTVVVAILAAYPLSRYRMRINKPFLYGILFGTGLPITAMMVPVYSLFVSLNLIDSIGTESMKFFAIQIAIGRLRPACRWRSGWRRTSWTRCRSRSRRPRGPTGPRCSRP